jgi:hypothetical protein
MSNMNNWIYEKNNENTARFVLGERGSNPLVCFGINPSTAEPNKLDNTLRRVRNEAITRGHDGWVMLNIYPQRATNPNDLHKEFNKDIHMLNLFHIKSILSSNPKVLVWAAWGGLINKRDYLSFCLKEIIEVMPISAQWVHVGSLLKNNHPHHPLYLRRNLTFNEFKIHSYLTNKKFGS